MNYSWTIIGNSLVKKKSMGKCLEEYLALRRNLLGNALNNSKHMFSRKISEKIMEKFLEDSPRTLRRILGDKFVETT